MTTAHTTNPTGIEQLIPQRNPLKFLFSWEWVKALIFLNLSFVVGLGLFVLLVTLFAVGISLTLSVILAVLGIPILGVMLIIMPFVGHLDRFRIRLLTDVEIPNPYRPLPDGKLGDKTIAFLSDGALWRDLLYATLLFPIGIVQYIIATVGFFVPVTMIASPLIIIFTGEMQFGPGTTIETVPGTFPLVIGGVILLTAAGYVFVILARGHALFARWLIGPSDRERLERRVETLSETRSRMVGVSLEDRRSIERDIHDSTQPKLVSLAMSLGMAREKLESDPEQARQLVESAHEEAREVLTEIRNLVRGLHPSILTDRGLEAAIRSLAGYCAVPVRVEVTLDERPREAVETTAYYIVAETLTNVAKHSHATEAHVIVQKRNGTLAIDVVDDGRGGAAAAPSSGLSGLQDRAAALDGELTISSPDGGPTRISARLPCES